MSKHKSVIGIVENTVQAERAVDALQSERFNRNDISVLLPDRRGTKDFAYEHNTKAPEGAIAGVAGGGLLGGALGLLAGIGAIAIPGLGAFIVAGPIFSALSGAAAGATVGGVAGALIGIGIPEIEAKRYEGKVRSGNILVAVHVTDDVEEKLARALLEREGAHDVSAAGETAVPRGQAERRA